VFVNTYNIEIADQVRHFVKNHITKRQRAITWLPIVIIPAKLRELMYYLNKKPRGYPLTINEKSGFALLFLPQVWKRQNKNPFRAKPYAAPLMPLFYLFSDNPCIMRR